MLLDIGEGLLIELLEVIDDTIELRMECVEGLLGIVEKIAGFEDLSFSV